MTESVSQHLEMTTQTKYRMKTSQSSKTIPTTPFHNRVPKELKETNRSKRRKKPSIWTLLWPPASFKIAVNSTRRIVLVMLMNTRSKRVCVCVWVAGWVGERMGGRKDMHALTCWHWHTFQHLRVCVCEKEVGGGE